MAQEHSAVLMPHDVSTRVGFFDRFAGWAALIASRAPFFAFCLLLVVCWLTQGAITLATTGDVHKLLDSTYQLEINTTTTIITFLMVALLQNSQTRTDQATQHKLNAIADGLADMMERWATHCEDEASARTSRSCASTSAWRTSRARRTTTSEEPATTPTSTGIGVTGYKRVTPASSHRRLLA